MITSPPVSTGSDARVLQAIYDQLRERNAWPTFAQIDRVLDRQLGIANAEAALAAIPAEYLVRSRHRVSYTDVDEIRLTLHGVSACNGAERDLQLLVELLRWAADRERAHDSDEPLILSSAEFADHVGLPVEIPVMNTAGEENTEGDVAGPPSAATPPLDPAAQAPILDEVTGARASLARVGVLAMSIPRFWTSAGHQEHRWNWTFTVGRGIRQFRDLPDVSRLLELEDEHRRATTTDFESLLAGLDETGGSRSSSGTPLDTRDADVITTPGDQLDVLTTLLRPEIADAAGTQLRSGLFDDAVFTAYRRVEHEIQQRTRMAAIGDTLVRAAFGGGSPRITISTRPGDADRMVEIFSGVLGLHKGDRSHKDKPALPCRSQRECLRLLAQASALLDLLDHGIEQAPRVDGYRQHDDLLELSVARVGPAAHVWLDDQLCLVRARTAATLTVDITAVPAGAHDLYIVDGARQGPAVPIFIISGPGRTNWYRVTAVNIELFRDEAGTPYSDVFGVRIQALESGMRNERILVTAERYEVGDYVDWEFSTRAVGPVWTRLPGHAELIKIFDGTMLLHGRVIGPGQPPRTVGFSLEPPVLKLRRGDKVPLRALRHISDGVATWTEPLGNPAVKPDDQRVAYFEGGTVIAKQDGTTALRLHHDGQYCAATVEVAAHPCGAVADLLTGLPPVAGLACIGDVVVVSTRERSLWAVNNGKYRLLAAVPAGPLALSGTDTIAGATNGDLAVRISDHRGITVLLAADEYRRSRTIELPERRTVTSTTWLDSTLLVGTDQGEIWQVGTDGRAQRLATVDGFVVALAAQSDVVYVLAGSGPRRLLRFSTAAPCDVKDALEPGTVGDANSIMCLGKEVYLTEFANGQVVRVAESAVDVVVDGLVNPCALAAGTDGTIYVAEFGRGAVRRILH